MRRLILIAGLGVLLAGCGTVGPAGVSPTPAGTASPSPTGVARCTSVSVSLSADSPVTAGVQVGAVAEARGCGPVEWRFRLVDAGTNVGVVTQQWGPSNTWRWDTTTWSPGRYLVVADARAYGVASGQPDASGQAELALVHAGPSPTAVARCTSVALTASAPSPVTAGTRLTITARAAGCTASELRFSLVDISTGVGVVTQAWSASASWTWDTTGVEAGRWAVQVDARAYGVPSDAGDATGTIEVDIVHAAPA